MKYKIGAKRAPSRKCVLGIIFYLWQSYYSQMWLPEYQASLCFSLPFHLASRLLPEDMGGINSLLQDRSKRLSPWESIFLQNQDPRHNQARLCSANPAVKKYSIFHCIIINTNCPANMVYFICQRNLPCKHDVGCILYHFCCLPARNNIVCI